MASCGAKNHHVLYGANATKMFALYSSINKNELYLCPAPLQGKHTPNIEKRHNKGLEHMAPPVNMGLQPLSQFTPCCA